MIAYHYHSERLCVGEASKPWLWFSSVKCSVEPEDCTYHYCYILGYEAVSNPSRPNFIGWSITVPLVSSFQHLVPYGADLQYTQLLVDLRDFE